MVNLGSDLQQVTSMGRNKTHNIHNVTDGQEISSGALETSDAGKTDNALGTYWKRVGTYTIAISVLTTVGEPSASCSGRL
jgi:hypothetical protein